MSNEFDYTKLKHATSVDQSDREVPYNLRQSGPTKVEMLISTRVRKSPYWHLSMEAGCWRATVLQSYLSSQRVCKTRRWWSNGRI